MRIVVTGGSGFIGWHVVQTALRHGASVRVLVRSQAAAGRLQGTGAVPVYGDIATGAGLDSAFAGADAVFHVAAHYSLDRRDGPLIYRTNVDGTRHVLRAAQRAHVERLVYTSSTATVALDPSGRPADESRYADPDATGVDYKRSKILAERLVLAAAAEGFDAVVVNPSTPVGWGDVKPTPTGRLVRDALFGRLPAYVATGLNFVAVGDVAEGHWLALERGRRGERYILGHENLTLAEFLSRVARLAGRRPPRIRLPWGVAWALAVLDEGLWTPLTGRPPRVPLAGVELARRPHYFSAAKAVRELGLPQTPLDQAITEALAWFKNPYPAVMKGPVRE
ncbi:MAG: NAD-dependent epimerase/dehydratase family protein [Actinomycetia bacterium]|nr:NAD-dependent epimerase/dehydratase family protein [Actinomycetes bacterium]